MILTKEQAEVISGITSAIKKQQIVTLGGYAGTGKTTVIQELNKNLKNYAIAAYTGKAANILRKKGLTEASTIHSLIYVPQLDDQGNIILDKNDMPVFILNPNLQCDGIVIDEASMVNQEIFEDLRSFGVPVIFVGDHGQLPPIGSDINLMETPDFKLETIHRNAGEIAFFAEYIRNGYRPAAYANKNPKNIKFINKTIAAKYYTYVDQIICAFNKTRVEINQNVRSQLGFSGLLPQVGEKIMCLRNNKTHNIFNGMQGTVESLDSKFKNKLKFKSDNNFYDVFFDPKQFNKEKYDFSFNRQDPDPFDFCSAITAYKAQGDEWDDVMVIEQFCKMWSHPRWCYTAASRAKRKLIWAF